MADEFDKIRILWIDDCEGRDAGYLYPEKDLPTVDYDTYFTILKHPDISAQSTIEKPEDFQTCFGPFWADTTDTDLLPPEIIAMDYVLKKWQDITATVEDSNDEVPEYLRSDSDKNVSNVVDATGTDANVEGGAGFEGLVLGIFTSSLLHRHPIGIVPMTNYGDLLESVPEVRAIHLISKEILHVDYSEFGVSGQDRSWKNVLTKGVQALRKRIEWLYSKNLIVLWPADLMALADDPSHGVLTLRSPHALRKLPVQGLFIDVPEDERSRAIKEWANSLMRSVMVNCEDLKNARVLANELFERYSDPDLVDAREKLSILTAHKNAGKTIDNAEYEYLCGRFGVTGGKCKKEWWDIRYDKRYSDRVRRWAALFITLKMLKRTIQVNKQLRKFASDTTGIDVSVPKGPVLHEDDLFLALFPVPNNPIVYPWHEGKDPSHHSETWTSCMLSWAADDNGETRRGKNLALSVRDLLAGENWRPQGPYGLTDSERNIIWGFALSDREVKEEEWLDSECAKLVLKGKEQREDSEDE